MKFSYVSDLHTEGGLPESFELPGGDVLFLAGDIVVVNRMMNLGQHYENYYRAGNNDAFHRVLAPQFAKYKHVYAILGNHEHYMSEFTETLTKYRNLAQRYKNFKVLNDRVIGLAPGLKLFAGTFWTDYNGGDERSKKIAAYYMNDHRLISYQHKVFSPTVAEELNRKARTKLFRLVEKSDDKWIIMTHHSPSMRGCHAKYGNSEANHAFHNTGLDEFLSNSKNILYWVHGHTHDTCNYSLGACHVLCNPKGYGNGSRQENKAFDINASFEVNI